MNEDKAGADRGEAPAARLRGGSPADDGIGEERFAAFGMWKDRRDIDDVHAWLGNMRRGRFHDL